MCDAPLWGTRIRTYEGKEKKLERYPRTRWDLNPQPLIQEICALLLWWNHFPVVTCVTSFRKIISLISLLLIHGYELKSVKRKKVCLYKRTYFRHLAFLQHTRKSTQEIFWAFKDYFNIFSWKFFSEENLKSWSQMRFWFRLANLSFDPRIKAFENIFASDEFFSRWHFSKSWF